MSLAQAQAGGTCARELDVNSCSVCLSTSHAICLLPISLHMEDIVESWLLRIQELEVRKDSSC